MTTLPAPPQASPQILGRSIEWTALRFGRMYGVDRDGNVTVVKGVRDRSGDLPARGRRRGFLASARHARRDLSW